MKNKNIYALAALLIFIIAAGLIILVPKNKSRGTSPITRDDQECRIQECHGLNLTCKVSEPLACTTEYRMDDTCRSLVSCTKVNGDCKLIESNELKVCKSCVEKCDADNKNTPDKAIECAIACVTTETSSDSGQIGVYTLEEVKAHVDESSCWTVVRDNVYDVTSAIDKHKGGRENILKLCGIDASDAFVKKHGGQEKPESWLETLKIGTLVR